MMGNENLPSVRSSAKLLLSAYCAAMKYVQYPHQMTSHHITSHDITSHHMTSPTSPDCRLA